MWSTPLAYGILRAAPSAWRSPGVCAAKAVRGVGTPLSIINANVVFARAADGPERGLALYGKGESSKKNVRAWLDSGANETMFRESTSIATDIRHSRMEIDTAHRGDHIGASKMGKVVLKNGDGTAMGGFDNVLFADGLTENLVSVGRITDCGMTVVFTKTGSMVYDSDYMATGKLLHTEERDGQTGLYPITLTLEPMKIKKASAYSGRAEVCLPSAWGGNYYAK